MPESDSLRVSLTVAVCAESGERLLMVRKKDTGLWGLPAGHLRDGETVLDAARREASEEAGVAIIPFAILGLYFFPKKEGLTACVVVRAFVNPKAIFKPQDREVQRVEWRDPKWVRYLITSGELYRPEYTAHNLVDWLNGALFPLTLLREFPGGWAE